MLFYEFGYGQTNVRQKDYAKTYNITRNTMVKVLLYRLQIELKCRERWPMYVTHEEDMKFCEEKWNNEFGDNGPPVIMHDTTNIKMAKPSAGDMQRALYNSYYSQTCAKAGVSCQLCSWIFGNPLVTGHSNDDQQLQQSKILELQEKFMEQYGLETFLNIFDKGYHQTLQAKRRNQITLQPDKAEQIAEDSKCLLRAASVAVARSGNERAVKRAKVSWFIRRGMDGSQWDIDFLCDVWEAWTFRINFMYEGFQ